MPKERRAKAVLITGASTGIGAAAAKELDRLGFCVYAGVRKREDGERLAADASDRLRPIMLDVTDAAMIAAAAERLQSELGEDGLAGLVNNAGIAVAAPLELVPIEQFRRQLEVNVVGPLAVAQAMLPLIRAARGRIVNIGSVNGCLAPPFLGPYAASKFAMEAVGDALRVELEPWGIHVSIVEAGPTATPIWEKSGETADQLTEQIDEGAVALYRERLGHFREAVKKLVASATPVARVVACVVHAITAATPRPRYLVDAHSQTAFLLLRFTPARLRDWLVKKSLRID